VLLVAVDRALDQHDLVAVADAGGPDLPALIGVAGDLHLDPALARANDPPQLRADLLMAQEAAQRPAPGLVAAVRGIRMLRRDRLCAAHEQQR
jgi:hypothetical protein